MRIHEIQQYKTNYKLNNKPNFTGYVDKSTIKFLDNLAGKASTKWQPAKYIDPCSTNSYWEYCCQLAKSNSYSIDEKKLIKNQAMINSALENLIKFMSKLHPNTKLVFKTISEQGNMVPEFTNSKTGTKIIGYGSSWLKEKDGNLPMNISQPIINNEVLNIAPNEILLYSKNLLSDSSLPKLIDTKLFDKMLCNMKKNSDGNSIFAKLLRFFYAKKTNKIAQSMDMQDKFVDKKLNFISKKRS